MKIHLFSSDSTTNHSLQPVQDEGEMLRTLANVIEKTAGKTCAKANAISKTIFVVCYFIASFAHSFGIGCSSFLFALKYVWSLFKRMI